MNLKKYLAIFITSFLLIALAVALNNDQTYEFDFQSGSFDVETDDKGVLIPAVDGIEFFFVNSLNGIDDPKDTSPTSTRRVGKGYGGTRVFARLYIDTDNNNSVFIIVEYFCDRAFLSLRNTEISYLKNSRVLKPCPFNRNKVFRYLVDTCNEYTRTDEFKKVTDSFHISSNMEVYDSCLLRIDEYEEMDFTGKKQTYGEFTYKFDLREIQ